MVQIGVCTENGKVGKTFLSWHTFFEDSDKTSPPLELRLRGFGVYTALSSGAVEWRQEERPLDGGVYLTETEVHHGYLQPIKSEGPKSISLNEDMPE